MSERPKDPVVALAEATFGTREKARRWLERPTLALRGRSPAALLATADGRREVKRLLVRIDFGLAP